MYLILGVISEMFASAGYTMVRGIYSSVARIYDILIDLAKNGATFSDFRFKNITTTLYVLAGVFMLFRVVIALVQMLIDPDKINDSKVGAEKLITRIFVSLIMLFLFVPNGLLFGKDGVFHRLEAAILDDGLISQMIPSTSVYSESKNSNSLLAENVYAGEKKNMECYYFKADFSGSGSKISNLYKIGFYNYNASGSSLLGEQDVGGGELPVYYKIFTGNIDGKSENGNYSSDISRLYAGSTLFNWGKFEKGYSNGCPVRIVEENSKWRTSKTGASNYTTFKTGLYGGVGSYTELRNAVSRAATKINARATTQFGSNADQYKAVVEGDGLDGIMDSINGSFIRDVNNYESITFAQDAASTFIECSNDCSEDQHKMFATTEGDEAMLNRILSDGEDSASMDFIIAMLVGIALIIYLAFLCVDVIIRKFKLSLLEIIAPLPIISYVDPSDKRFNEWFKMYISTYIDLFIKLIAISFALSLIDVLPDLIGDDSRLFVKFCYLVAILLFAKLIPSLISKIMGIEISAGSFKDIKNMAMGVAGSGVGSVAGGIAGLGTGIAAGVSSFKNSDGSFKSRLGKGLASGFGRGISNSVTGAIQGAGSGSKGKVFGGASNVLAAGKKQREAAIDGATIGGTAAATLNRMIGRDDEYQREENAIKKLKNKNVNPSGALSSIKSFNDAVEGNMKNKGGDAGYRNISAVNDWLNKKDAYDAAVKTGDVDKISSARQAMEDAYKPAFDAAKNEELRRIRENDNADVSAQTAIQNYDYYVDGIDDPGIQLKKSSDAGFSKSDLGDSKDKLTAITSKRKAEIDSRTAALEVSVAKANHDIAQKQSK